MKRTLAILLALALALCCVAAAEVVATSDESLFSYAVGMLRQVNNRTSVASAEEVFGNITSGYGYANLYQVYCQAILAIHDESLDEAEMRFDLLNGRAEFAGSLESSGLPSCGDFLAYLAARRAEAQGRILDAMATYRGITLMDSVQRSVDLADEWRVLAYDEACALMQRQEYEKAAELFDQLGGYGDSAVKANQARALIPTPTPEVTATPVPEYRPLAKGDKGDEVLQMQNRLFLLGFMKASRDGIYGGKTQAAVKAFQNAAGLEATGSADNATLTALYADNAPRAEGALISAPPTPQATPEVTPVTEATPEAETTPTLAPTPEPTEAPTPEPTEAPTAIPTAIPTAVPTAVPTAIPTALPTAIPTVIPTAIPTTAPTAVPNIAFQTPVPGLPSPSLDFYWYDEVGVLSEQVRAEIVNANRQLYNACGVQIVVAAINTTGSMSIDQYGEALFNAWGIGDASRNNGFLLLLAIGDDNYYAISGSGLDAQLTSNRIVNLFGQYLEPDFAVKNYSEGARKMFEAVFNEISALYGVNHL